MSRYQDTFSGKVLIVDDELIVRILAGEALAQAGFQVRTIDDGSQVAALLGEFVPDIILLDVVMPGLDGYATCAELRRSEPGADIPVLMMTGFDDLESLQSAYQAGATDFITKPIHWQGLPYRVQYIIRSSQAYKELKTNKILLSQAQRLAGIGSWQWHLSNDTFLWSEELYQIFIIDRQEDDRTSHSFFRFIHPLDQVLVKSAIEAAVAGKTNLSIDHRVILPTGTELNVHTEAVLEFDGDGLPCKMLGIVQDITERKRAEEQISYMAYYDTLTRLPNRQLFNDRLTQALRRSERAGEKLAVLFIDLDDFKLINDSHGHRVGDLMLEEVARRLEEETRANDTLARLGGDEFTILLHDVKSEENVLLVAQKHLHNLQAAYQLDNKQLFISASIGVALYPDHGDTVEVLVKSADVAMYQAKEKGKNHIEFFTEELYSKASERLSLQGDLRRALEQEEFVLHYQPRINLLTGCWSGVEALVRWQHPERGLLLPLTFIHLAEETGLIMPLGEWVLREACQQLHRWHDEGLNLARISVNVSPLQFRRQNILELVKSAVSNACLCSRALELEITESALMHDMAQSIATLQRLQHLGVNISIDDFGTGYSSLSHLRTLPINILKIDRSFLRTAHESADDAQILSSIIAMAQSLNLAIVAEGVECAEHEALLQQQHCREAQGFFYARPMPADELTCLLRDGNHSFEPVASRSGGDSQQPCSLPAGDTNLSGDGPQPVCLQVPGRPLACQGRRFCATATVWPPSPPLQQKSGKDGTAA